MNKIQHAFDRAAENYDQHCHVQLHAGNTLAQLIHSHRHEANRLLDLGCGTGLTTEVLAAIYHDENFHAVDISAALLEKAKQRRAASRIQYYQLNFDELLPADSPFDIIFSNMALQWSANLPSVLQNIQPLLNHDGIFGFSIPLAGTFSELQPHCAVNHFHEQEIIHQFLVQNDYEILAEEKHRITLDFPDTLQALQSIRQIGANQVIQPRARKGLRTTSWLRQINMNELTYVIGYFVAEKRS